jgi:hypothetical protein
MLRGLPSDAGGVAPRMPCRRDFFNQRALRYANGGRISVLCCSTRLGLLLAGRTAVAELGPRAGAFNHTAVEAASPGRPWKPSPRPSRFLVRPPTEPRACAAAETWRAARCPGVGYPPAHFSESPSAQGSSPLQLKQPIECCSKVLLCLRQSRVFISIRHH